MSIVHLRCAGAVSEPTKRIRGTDNLYVIDASVFPTVPSLANLTAMMLGERVADWLAAVGPNN